jgi:hypothetical protein
MAERNFYLERLTHENCAMVLIDQQTGTMLGVQDFPLDNSRRNVLRIAGAAKLHKLPTVLTGSYVEGPNGPIMSELLEMFPDTPTILRSGVDRGHQHGADRGSLLIKGVGVVAARYCRLHIPLYRRR